MVEYKCNAIYGDIYGRTTTVRVDRKLETMPSAQAGVIDECDGGHSLMSYATKVATIDAGGWLTCSGTYGRATIRHIGQFLKEYGEGGANYYNAKYCYQNDMAYNVRTGEILELAEYFKLAKNRIAA